MPRKRGSVKDWSHVQNFPEDGVVQRVGQHLYVIRRTYVLNPETKKYGESREQLGQIVDDVFYTKEQYQRTFQRGKAKRALVTATGNEFLQTDWIETLSIEQLNWLSNMATTGTAGAVPILVHLAKSSGLAVDLETIYGREIALEVLSLAIYFIVNGNNSASHYQDFAGSHHLPWSEPLSGQRISEFYQSLGQRQNLRQAFFMRRVARLTHDDDVICVDSTTVSTSASRYCLSQVGKSKDDTFESQVGLMVSFNQCTHAPLCYRVIPGNVNDVKTIAEWATDLSDLGLNKRCIGTFDRGYLSASNLAQLSESGMKCCIVLKLQADWTYEVVDAAIEQIIAAETIRGSDAVKGITFKREVMHGQKSVDVWVHVFFSEWARVREKTTFLRQLESFEDLWNSKGGRVKTLMRNKKMMQYFDVVEDEQSAVKSLARRRDVIDEHMRYYGYFGTVTNFECSPQTCYDTYDLRSDIEQVFRSGKQDIALNVLRTHANLTSEGKMFVSFVALCLLESLKQELATQRTKKVGRKEHVELRQNEYCIDDVLSVCKSVRYHRRPNGTEVFYLAPTEEQNRIARAAGCEDVYLRPAEY